jgi:predicted permease
MSWFTRLVRHRALDRELDRELQFHLDSATADFIRAGHSPAEARRLARLEFGGPPQIREDTRDARGTRWVEDWLTDTRYAFRAMRRAPAFTAAAVLTLAIGVGANTAIWSIIDALMRRPLPVERPEELRAIKLVGVEDDKYRMSHPMMLGLRAALPDSIGVAGTASVLRLYVSSSTGTQPEAVIGQLVSGNFFRVVGVRSAAGRLLTPDDDKTLGASPVIVLSDRYWERRFARDRSVIGRTIRINGYPMTVIGVAQPGFEGLTIGSTVDVYAPLVMQQELRYRGNAYSSNSNPDKPWIPQDGISWLTAIVRVAPSQAAAIESRIEGTYRVRLQQSLADRDSVERVTGMREHVSLQSLAHGFSPLRDQFRDPLRALMVGVAIILMIACANLAALVLARNVARTHELAIRASLGARDGRHARQVLTETLTVSALGGVVGLFLARWMIGILLTLASSGTRAIPLHASLDGRVLAFALALTVLAGLLVGLAPAIRTTRIDLYDSFKTGGRVVRGGHRLPVGRVLVAGQIALAFVLVASAAIFVRTFQNFVNLDAGFEREQLVTARLDTRAAGYTPDELQGVYGRLLDAARAVPGVQRASLSFSGIATNARRTSGFAVPGRALGSMGRSAQENVVSSDYFRTVGMTLVAGRSFGEQDTKDSPKVVVISQTAARQLFGTDSVIGARFGHDTPPELEVIGVVRDARFNTIREAPPAMVYRLLDQQPREYLYSLETRVTGRADLAASALQKKLVQVDPKLPVRDVVPIEDLVERGLTRERLVSRLAGAFGVLALLLAVVGLYGVVSYSVARRTNEMGVRLALGASPRAISRIVMSDASRTIAAGIVLGVLLWLPLIDLTRRLVYGISPGDPRMLSGTAAALVVAGLAAAWLPAWRAARIDPIEAIRTE